MIGSRSLIRQHVLDSVVEVFRVRDPRTISESTSARDVEGWNSLSHTMLLMAIEEKLGVELSLEHVYGAATLGELIDIISAGTTLDAG